MINNEFSHLPTTFLETNSWLDSSTRQLDLRSCSLSRKTVCLGDTLLSSMKMIQTNIFYLLSFRSQCLREVKIELCDIDVKEVEEFGELRSEDDHFLLGITSQDPASSNKDEFDLRSEDDGFLLAAGIAVSQSLNNSVQYQIDPSKSQDCDGAEYQSQIALSQEDLGGYPDGDGDRDIQPTFVKASALMKKKSVIDKYLNSPSANKK